MNDRDHHTLSEIFDGWRHFLFTFLVIHIAWSPRPLGSSHSMLRSVRRAHITESKILNGYFEINRVMFPIICLIDYRHIRKDASLRQPAQSVYSINEFDGGRGIERIASTLLDLLIACALLPSLLACFAFPVVPGKRPNCVCKRNEGMPSRYAIGTIQRTIEHDHMYSLSCLFFAHYSLLWRGEIHQLPSNSSYSDQ